MHTQKTLALTAPQMFTGCWTRTQRTSRPRTPVLIPLVSTLHGECKRYSESIVCCSLLTHRNSVQYSILHCLYKCTGSYYNWSSNYLRTVLFFVRRLSWFCIAPRFICVLLVSRIIIIHCPGKCSTYNYTCVCYTWRNYFFKSTVIHEESIFLSYTPADADAGCYAHLRKRLREWERKLVKNT